MHSLEQRVLNASPARQPCLPTRASSPARERNNSLLTQTCLLPSAAVSSSCVVQCSCLLDRCHHQPVPLPLLFLLIALFTELCMLTGRCGSLEVTPLTTVTVVWSLGSDLAWSSAGCFYSSSTAFSFVISLLDKTCFDQVSRGSLQRM